MNILTGSKRNSFMKLLSVNEHTKTLNPFMLVSINKTKFTDHLLVVPLQFDELGIQFEHPKFPGIEKYPSLPKTFLIPCVKDSQIGSKITVYLTQAFKNNQDDVACGIQCKNGVLWGWFPLPPTPTT